MYCNIYSGIWGPQSQITFLVMLSILVRIWGLTTQKNGDATLKMPLNVIDYLKMWELCVFLVASLVITAEYLPPITFILQVQHRGVRSLLLYFGFIWGWGRGRRRRRRRWWWWGYLRFILVLFIWLQGDDSLLDVNRLLSAGNDCPWLTHPTIVSVFNDN